MMTPQQQRIFSLQASRNWGPFTDAEQAHLNTEFKRRRTRPGDVEKTDLSSVIRVLKSGEVVPENLVLHFHHDEPTKLERPKRVKDKSIYGTGDSTFVKQPVYESPYGITSAQLYLSDKTVREGWEYEGEK